MRERHVVTLAFVAFWVVVIAYPSWVDVGRGGGNVSVDRWCASVREYTIIEEIELRPRMSCVTALVPVPQNDTWQASFVTVAGSGIEEVEVESVGSMVVIKLRACGVASAVVQSQVRVIGYATGEFVPAPAVEYPHLIKGDDVWDVDGDLITAAVEESRAYGGGAVDAACAWVRDHLRLTPSPHSRLGSGALTIEGGSKVILGDCAEAADVLVSMLRSEGIPSVAAYGLFLPEEKGEAEYVADEWPGHAWVRVLSVDRIWFDVDPATDSTWWSATARKPVLILYGVDDGSLEGRELFGSFLVLRGPADISKFSLRWIARATKC